MLILIVEMDSTVSNYLGIVRWWWLATLRPLFNRETRCAFRGVHLWIVGWPGLKQVSTHGTLSWASWCSKWTQYICLLELILDSRSSSRECPMTCACKIKNDPLSLGNINPIDALLLLTIFVVWASLSVMDASNNDTWWYIGSKYV